MPDLLKTRIPSKSKQAIERILRFIKKHDNFLVSGHVRSDGDALGSQLALNRLLHKLGKKSHVVCDRGVSSEYKFLPGAKGVGSGPGDLKSHYDAVFTVDSGSWERLERVKDALPKNVFIVNVDHHASNGRFGNINWINPTFASCGEMVYELIKASKVKIDYEMALPIYVAMITDTGRFSFSNTKTETHLRAAELLRYGIHPAEVHKAIWRDREMNQLKLLAICINHVQRSRNGHVAWLKVTREMMRECCFVPTETQEYIDMVKSIKGVQVAVLLREDEDELRKVKISFRTEKNVDGVKLAAKFGGGGHPRASGATFCGTIEEAEKQVITETLRSLRNGRRQS